MEEREGGREKLIVGGRGWRLGGSSPLPGCVLASISAGIQYAPAPAPAPAQHQRQQAVLSASTVRYVIPGTPP